MVKKERKEYLSVEEFAEKAGVSVSTIYRHMKGKLSQFIISENGKKCLVNAGLELYGFPRDSQKFLNEKSENSDFNEEISRVLRKTIDNLETQLEIKDRQIDQLNTALMNQQVLHKDSLGMLLPVKEDATEKEIKTDIHGRLIDPDPIVEKAYKAGQEYQKRQDEDEIDELRYRVAEQEVKFSEDNDGVIRALEQGIIRIEGGNVLYDGELPEHLCKLLQEGYSSGFNEARPFWKKKI